MNAMIENKDLLIGKLQEYLDKIQRARPKYGKFSKWVLLLGAVSLIAELTLLNGNNVLVSPLVVVALLLFGNIALAIFYQLARRKDMLKDFSFSIITPLLNSFFPQLKYAYEGEPVDDKILAQSDIFPKGRSVVLETKHHMAWPQGAAGYWANVIIDMGAKMKDYQVKGFIMRIPLAGNVITPLILNIDQEMPYEFFQTWVGDKIKETKEEYRNTLLEKIVQYKFKKAYSLHFSLKDNTAFFFIKAHSFLGQRLDLTMEKHLDGKIFFDTVTQEIKWLEHLESLGNSGSI